MWFDHVTTVPLLQMAVGASSSAVGVMTNEQLTTAVLDLGKMVAGIHGFLLGPLLNPPPTSQQQLLPPLLAWIAGLSKPIYTPPSLDSTGTAPSASAQDPPPASVPSSTGAQLAGLVLGVPVPPFTGAQPSDQIATAAATVQVALAQKSDCQSATVRLQATACGLLARRRLQEMHWQMHEAALTAIDLGKGESP
jgi:hypothetical protein